MLRILLFFALVSSSNGQLAGAAGRVIWPVVRAQTSVARTVGGRMTIASMSPGTGGVPARVLPVAANPAVTERCIIALTCWNEIKKYLTFNKVGDEAIYISKSPEGAVITIEPAPFVPSATPRPVAPTPVRYEPDPGFPDPSAPRPVPDPAPPTPSGPGPAPNEPTPSNAYTDWFPQKPPTSPRPTLAESKLEIEQYIPAVTQDIAPSAEDISVDIIIPKGAIVHNHGGWGMRLVYIPGKYIPDPVKKKVLYIDGKHIGSRGPLRPGMFDPMKNVYDQIYASYQLTAGAPEVVAGLVGLLVGILVLLDPTSYVPSYQPQWGYCCHPEDLKFGEFCYDYVSEQSFYSSGDAQGDCWETDGYELSDGNIVCNGCFRFKSQCVLPSPLLEFAGTGCQLVTVDNNPPSWACSPHCPTKCKPQYAPSGQGGCCVECPFLQFAANCTEFIFVKLDVNYMDYVYFSGFEGVCTPCSSCALGQYPFHACTPFTDIMCLPCPIGTYGSVDQSPDYYIKSLLDDLHICISCALGKYQTTLGSTYCDPCPTGTYSTNPQVGYCYMCSPGTFNPYQGQSTCYSCSPGSYSTGNQQIYCQSCEPGKYQAYHGHTQCDICRIGSYQSMYGQPQCPSCVQGFFTTSTGSTLCQRCAFGTFSNVNDATACYSCPLGTAQRASGSTYCLNCPAGEFNDVYGAFWCTQCLPGTYSPSGASSCVTCPIGSFTNDLAPPTCRTCLKGEFCAKPWSWETLTKGLNLCDLSNSGAKLNGCSGGRKIWFEANGEGPRKLLDYCPSGCTNSSITLPCNQTYYKGVISAPYSCRQCYEKPRVPLGCNSPGFGECFFSKQTPCGCIRESLGSICLYCQAGFYTEFPHFSACRKIPAGSYSPIAGSHDTEWVALETSPASWGTNTWPVSNGWVACYKDYTSDFCSFTRVFDSSRSIVAVILQGDGVGSWVISMDIQNMDTGETWAISGNQDSNTAVITFLPSAKATTLTYRVNKFFSTGIRYGDDYRYVYLFRMFTVLKRNSSLWTPCPIGTYSNDGQSACTACSVGKISSELGATACLDCPSGTFNNIGGRSFCSICIKGFYSTSPMSCIFCPISKYQPLDMQSSCLNCPAYTYNTGMGLTLCIRCTAGTSSDSGASSCYNCWAGSATIGQSGTACSVCTKGTYSTGWGGIICNNCLSGMSSNPNSTFCFLCPPGSREESKVCLFCSAGQYSTGYASITCINCSGGMSSNINSTTCYLCPPGSREVSNLCLVCPAQQYANRYGSINCTDCSLGAFSNFVNMTACVSCIQGTFSPITGQSLCISCSPGTFQERLGQSLCVLCGVGFYSSGYGISSCTPCPPGKYISYTTKTRCERCATGSYGNHSGMSSCSMCEPGTYSALTEQTICLSCASGYVASGYGSTICSFCALVGCPLGKYISSCSKINPICGECGQGRLGTGMICVDCQAGYYQSLNASFDCIPCSPGMFTASSRSSACQSCSMNTAQPLSGSTACSQCLTGFYTSAVAQISCVGCPMGYYLAQSSSICSSCGIGMFSDNVGMSLCSSCSLGKYNNQFAVSACSNCDAGRFANTTGMSVCQACSKGSYSSSPGMSTCDLCQTGSFTVLPSATLCLLCTSGYFQGNQGQSQCNPCIGNTYQPGNGSTSCLTCPSGGRITNNVCEICPAGKYQNGSSPTICQACPSGTYSAVSGSTNCSDCDICNPTTSTTFKSCSGITPNVTCSCNAGFYQPSGYCRICPDCSSIEFTHAWGCSAFSTYSYCARCDECLDGYYNSNCSYNKNTHVQVCMLCNTSRCSKGQYLSSCSLGNPGTCQNCGGGCQDGFYRDKCGGRFIGNCSVCPDGSWYSGGGASSSLACINCTRGYYQNVSGVPCQACPIGYYQPSTSSILCLPCLAGTYQNISGKSVCVNCVGGTYSSSSSSSICTPCQSCSKNGALSTSCTSTQDTACTCNYGYAGDGFTCQNCPFGSYLTSPSASVCSYCNPGQRLIIDYSNMLNSECINCTHGTYTTQQGVTSCTECSNGYFQYEYGMSSCKSCSGACEVNKTVIFACKTTSDRICDCKNGFSSLNSICTECLAGQYSQIPFFALISRNCTACPVGKYSNTTGQSICVKCPSPTYQTSTQATTCILCGVGRARVNETTCIDCEPGTFSSTLGGSLCLTCPSWQYQTGSGSSNCYNCSAGNLRVNNTICAPCEPGKFSSAVGSVMCLECKPGTYQPNYGTTCLNCSMGSYQTGTGASSCIMCDTCGISGVTQAPCNVTHNITCKCNPGFVSNQFYGCYACNPGFFELNGSCISCPPGTFNVFASSTTCLRCGPGTFSDTIGSISCKNCSTGSYNQKWGVTNCTQCDFCDEHGLERSPCTILANPVCICDEDYYGNGLFCQPCPVCPYNSKWVDFCTPYDPPNCSCDIGLYFDNYTCSQCPPGTYRDYEGASNINECMPCMPGTYSPSTGLTQCLQCDSGMLSPYWGLSSCYPCRSCQAHAHVIDNCTSSSDTVCFCNPGYYLPAQESICRPCPMGLASPNGVTCRSCDWGTYNDEIGFSGVLTPDDRVLCKNCSVCHYTQVQIGPCFSQYDTACACFFGMTWNTEECVRICMDGYRMDEIEGTCVRCSPGTYSNESTDPITCLPCDECTPNSTLSSPCDGQSPSITCECEYGFYTSDTLCLPCELCDSDMYRAECTPLSSGGYCTPCEECPFGTYQSSCGSFSAGYCAPCDTCQNGTYRAGCSGRSPGNCTPCHITCGVGAQFVGCGELSPGYCKECPSETFNNKSNGDCLDCSVCPLGYYENVKCDNQTNRVCSACSNCSKSMYELLPCTNQSDTVCHNCTNCLDGYFQASNCGVSKDSTCDICLVCPTGYFAKSACNATHNTRCAPCSSCDDGYYIGDPCNSVNDTVCKLCVQCSYSTYQQLCSSTFQGVCLACDPCPLNMYREGCGNTSAGFCNSCKNDCGPGNYLDMCTGGFRGMCKMCPVNTYNNLTINGTCIDCSVCSVGFRVVSACNSTLDVVCESTPISYTLSCVSCRFLVMPGDPVGDLDPSKYQSNISLSSLSLVVNMSDSQMIQPRISRDMLVVFGAAVLVDDYIIPQQGGEIYIYVNSQPRSNVLIIPVYEQVVVSVSIFCNGISCYQVKLCPPNDAAMYPPFYYSAQLQVTVKLRLSTNEEMFMPIGNQTVKLDNTWLANGSTSILTQGYHVIQAFPPSIWMLSVPNASIFVAKLDRFLINSKPTLLRLHCSKLWENGTTSIQMNLTDGAWRDVTDYSKLTVVFPLLLLPKYTYTALDVGTGIITWEFGGAYYNENVEALNQSILFNLTISGIPYFWTAPIGDTKSINTGLSLDLTHELVSAYSSAPKSISVSTYLFCVLLGDHYDDVLIFLSFKGCETQPSIPFNISVSPHISPVRDGELDAGNINGTIVTPRKWLDTINLNIYIRSIVSPLRSFLLEIRVPPSLKITYCTGGVLRDTVCGFVNNLWRVVGSNLDSDNSNRVLIVTIQIVVLGEAEISWIHLDLLESRMGDTIRGLNQRNISIKVGPGGADILPFPKIDPVISNNTWGDTEGVGLFSSFSVQFFEEYLRAQRLNKRQYICVTKCQWTDRVSPWQLRMLSPVSNPNDPPQPLDDQSRIFLLGALVGRYTFISDWSIVSHPGNISISARLINPLSTVWFLLDTELNPNLNFDAPHSYYNGRITVFPNRVNGVWVSTSRGQLYQEGMVPFYALVSTEDLGGYYTRPWRYQFLSYRPMSLLNITSIKNTTQVSKPKQSQVPISLYVCCDEILAFPGSPATSFFPIEYNLRVAVVTYEDNSFDSPAWAQFTFQYDKGLFIFTYPNNFTVLPKLNYRGGTKDSIVVNFEGGNSTFRRTVRALINLTIVDVKKFSVDLNFPPPDDNTLKRVHCSSLFQRARLSASASIDGIDLEIPVVNNLFVSFSAPQILSWDDPYITGRNIGITNIQVAWWGYTWTMDAINVLNQSATFNTLTCPDYEFYGVIGEQQPPVLSGKLDEMLIDDIFESYGSLVTITPPISLIYASNMLTSRSNSDPTQQIQFEMATCGLYTPRCNAQVVLILNTDQKMLT